MLLEVQCEVSTVSVDLGCHAEAVLTLRDMTSDAQTPLAHATMLRDTSGFQWHMPKTCDMSMYCVLCHIVALRVAPSVVTDTCRWVPLYNVDCVTQALNAAVLNSSPRTCILSLCIFRMLLLSLQMFVLSERMCPAKWTSQDIPP